jgi:hypothetical protein
VAVAVQREAVDAEFERQQVQVLALMADRVGPRQPERFIKRSVDRLSIDTTLVQTANVLVGRWDGPTWTSTIAHRPRPLTTDPLEPIISLSNSTACRSNRPPSPQSDIRGLTPAPYLHVCRHRLAR